MRSEKRIVKSEKFAAAVLMFLMLLSGCKQEDDTIEIVPARHWVEKTVAVVAPIGDAPTKTRLERTANWFLDNFREAQMHDTLAIDLKIEWHDELSEDLTALSQRLASDSTVIAVIGPFSNEGVAAFAPACMKTQKPLIAPTATSEDIIRRYAVTTSGLQTNQSPFLWSLTATDVDFTSALMSAYAAICQRLRVGELSSGMQYTDTTPNAILFSTDDAYGKTFFDWAPFFAENYGIDLMENETYQVVDDVYDHMMAMSDESEIGAAFDIASAAFWVLETSRQLYEASRIRRKLIIEYYGEELFASDDPFAEENDAYWQTLQSIYRTYFAFSALSEEGLEAFGTDGRRMLQGCEGFSPYADPSTGFELSYKTRFGQMPTFAECKFYDALMLAAFAACYVEHGTLNVERSAAQSGADANVQRSMFNVQFNDAVVQITSGSASAPMGGSAWSATSMELYLAALERGQLLHFIGASGEISFDRDTYTAATTTTYVHWQIMDGQILHRQYFGSTGGRTADATAAWLYLYSAQQASDDFQQQASGGTAQYPTYPALTDQYAVLVQGSDGYINYRHQADVLSVYQALRRGGFPDDHIILIIDTDMSASPANPQPGTVRTSTDGPDLLSGTDNLPKAEVDYDSSTLTARDISNILKGIQTAATPVVIPPGAGNNVLLYWSGHGRSRANGGADEFVWRKTYAGEGFTADLLRETAEAMTFRKLCIAAEPCYGECVVRAVEGLPGVLAMSGANAAEQSWADHWSDDARAWLCDRFTLNLVTCLSDNPQTSFRDLFLYCAQHTLGSHARIVNADHFGNLFTTGPAEFLLYNNK